MTRKEISENPPPEFLTDFEELEKKYGDPLDTPPRPHIMTVEEVARFLRKSPSWVYKNWQKLSGVKLGGSLFFPRKEDLYGHLFRQGEGLGTISV